jgi:LysR family transcriptional regulator, nod-box dependent transcriptional activator
MRLNRLDLNQLVILDALLDERSPSKVAARLHVTQPAISAALRNLRAYFNDALFIQSGRKMAATPFAEGLAVPVRDLLLRGDQITRLRPSHTVATYRRIVKIAVSDFVATVLLAPILRSAIIQAPLVRFELVSVFDSRHHYHEDLERGEVDVLILPDDYASPKHKRQVILDEAYVCIACRNNRATKNGVSVEDYLKAGHVGVTNRTVAGRPYDEMHMARQGYKRRIDVAVPSLLWIPAMIVGTKRLSTVHYHLARDMARRWPIRILRCPVEIPPLREVMQWHEYQENDPAIAWLRSNLVAAAKRLSTARTAARVADMER